MDTDVLIVGAGPVGLTLAIDLAQRGIRTILIERNDRNGLLPKMERCNARTMEIFRRLGVSDQIRTAGLPTHCPMDVFIVTALNKPPILQLPYASVDELKREIAAHNDGTRPLEPYQLISQYTLEPLLRRIAETYDNASLRFGHELLSFRQDETKVQAQVRHQDDAMELSAKYLIGCDGGGSTVRKSLGISLQGQGRIRKMRQALFYSETLFDQMPIGKGRHYHVADDELTAITVQDSRKHFRMSTAWREGDDVVAKFRRVIGFDVPFDLLYEGEWFQHLLCAERYRDGRVFIAGDAAHLVIPTGGLGMNTGIGDVNDLGWKLAGTLAGWGGPGLLDSYETERRQVGLRNVKASGSAMAGRIGWRSVYKQNVADDTPEGAVTRAEIAKLADVEQRKTNEILGIELGYRYMDSPIICCEMGDGPDPDNRKYVPTTWPGARLPHIWLKDGSALQDRLGGGYSLLRFSSDIDVRPLEQAFVEQGMPIQVLTLDDDQARAIGECSLLLLRPDLHVVWRGEKLPDDTPSLAATALGWMPVRTHTDGAVYG